MKELFYLDKSPINGKYTIKMVDDRGFILTDEGGSYNVLPARLLGISYPDWLRFCRDEFGAELIGKNCLYICPYFESNTNTRSLVRLLNKIADIMIKDYNIAYMIETSKKEGVVPSLDY